MQRAAIRPGLNFFVGAFRLRIGQVFGERHDAVQKRIEAFEPSRYISVSSSDVTCRVRTSSARCVSG